eukprot:c48713_g1_i1 orf=88-270(+)
MHNEVGCFTIVEYSFGRHAPQKECILCGHDLIVNYYTCTHSMNLSSICLKLQGYKKRIRW